MVYVIKLQQSQPIWICNAYIFLLKIHIKSEFAVKCCDKLTLINNNNIYELIHILIEFNTPS